MTPTDDDLWKYLTGQADDDLVGAIDRSITTDPAVVTRLEALRPLVADSVKFDWHKFGLLPGLDKWVEGTLAAIRVEIHAGRSELRVWQSREVVNELWVRATNEGMAPDPGAFFPAAAEAMRKWQAMADPVEPGRTEGDPVTGDTPKVMSTFRTAFAARMALREPLWDDLRKQRPHEYAVAALRILAGRTPEEVSALTGVQPDEADRIGAKTLAWFVSGEANSTKGK
jgi:hypothetical protein